MSSGSLPGLVPGSAWPGDPTLWAHNKKAVSCNEARPGLAGWLSPGSTDTPISLKECMGRNLKPKPRARTSCTEDRVVTTGRACLSLLEGQPEAASALRPPAPQELPGPRCPEDSSLEHALGWPPLPLVSNHKEGCLPTALRNQPVLHLGLTDPPRNPPPQLPLLPLPAPQTRPPKSCPVSLPESTQTLLFSGALRDPVPRALPGPLTITAHSRLLWPPPALLAGKWGMRVFHSCPARYPASHICCVGGKGGIAVGK